jgi:hypothetical protein
MPCLYIKSTLLLVISKVRIIAFAFFRYVGIRLLNLSEPAVSQRISLIVLSSRKTF